MRNFEPRWVSFSFKRRLILYFLLPVFISWVGVYEQATALQRHYLYPYFESSVYRHSPASTTSVKWYVKFTKNEKKLDLLTEKDLVPALIAEPHQLPVELTAKARKQGWDHIASIRPVLTNSQYFAGWLKSNVYGGDGLWSLLWFFCWRYLAGLYLLFFFFYTVGNRDTFVEILQVGWQRYQAHRCKIQIQVPGQILSLPPVSKIALPAEQQEEAPHTAIEKRPQGKPPASATPRWTPSMWVDRSKMQADDEESR